MDDPSLLPVTKQSQCSEGSDDIDNQQNGGGSDIPDGLSSCSEETMIRKPSMLKSKRTHNPVNDLPQKKTVSFSSTPFEKSKSIINAPDCLHYMQQGSDLIKIRPSGRHYKRTYYLDSTMTEIRWTPSSKKKNKARILVEDLREVRTGKNTELLRNHADVVAHFQDGCVFSLLYGSEFNSLDVIAPTPDEASIWVTGLTCLLAGKGNNAGDSIESRQLMRDRWLQEVFSEADYDNKGFLDDGAVIRLMKSLNSGVATTRIRQKLKEVDVSRSINRGRLSSQEFVNLFKEISTRPEIYFLLVRYSSNGDYMSAEDLLLFLEVEQRLPHVTQEKCFEIIRQHEPSLEGREKGQLGIDGFTSYLLSEECHIFDPEQLVVCQDMTQPLSHYFIAASHKTYLLEDQLKGPSSVEGYVRSLLMACRYVEIECWDGANDEPIVYHGNTLTSKITLRSVLEAINIYAFRSSEYPLIISLEDHCSLRQQRVAVQLIKSILGPYLLTEPVDVGDPDQLPSPYELRKKIILKGKKIAPEFMQPECYVSEEDESVDYIREKANKKETSQKKRKLVRELSDLVVYCQSKRFENFQLSPLKSSIFEIYSLPESAAMAISSSMCDDFVNYNKRFLTRVYPNISRVDSSNYNPQDLWNCGCQVVCLNYQTSGLMMDLNTGFFSRNGACGYVLKPAVMRESLSFFSLHTKEGIPDVLPQTLHIRIISGQQLPRPKGSVAKGDVIDPYVVVEVFGIPADCAEEKTKTVPGNGYNPVFDESFEFQVNLADLALVRFIVLDDDAIGDEFIGQYSIPFDCIQTGYRHIRLRNNQGENIPNAYLFVHIAVTNKRGGPNLRPLSWKEKLSRRGPSMKRKHRRKLYPCLRKLGLIQIDEVFKAANGPLREGADLRINLQEALCNFRDACGLGSICNIKQCIRNLASKVANNDGSLTTPNSSAPPPSPSHNLTVPVDTDWTQGPLEMQVLDGYPNLVVSGNLPDAIRKAINAFQELVSHCKALVRNGESLAEKLLSIQQSGMEFYENLTELCNSAGLKSRKASRVTENFTWNVRLLLGQADLLRRARQEALDCNRQALEAARATGLFRASGSNNNSTSGSASPGIQPCFDRHEWQARADEDTVFL